MVIISEVENNSAAERAGIKKGEKLLMIDSHPIKDILDYRFFITEPKIILTIEDEAGKSRDISIKKPRYDDIGLIFDTFLMDKKKSCQNKCIFCFIDQNPCGMRETVYFKDDDTRLSFLMGNYVTLTNTSDEELSRIVKMRLSPVNISVHTMDPELRCKMLGNRFAGKIASQMKILFEGDIKMNIQIVLCRGINDGAALEKTISELEKFFPQVQSIAVVPAGLTKHRENLYPLSAFDHESAKSTIGIIEKYAQKFLKKYGSRFIFASDEFYLLANRDMPSEEEYEGYMQLDNGVGLLRNTENEILAELKAIEEYGEIPEYSGKKLKLVLATGIAASKLMQKICSAISEKLPDISIEVKTIANEFFGHSVTVAGLLTGSDYIRELKGIKCDAIIIPAVSLRAERDLFLDGLSVADIEKEIGKPIYPAENGIAIFDTLKEIISLS